MYENILKSFISRLGFLTNKLDLNSQNFQINIINNQNELNEINGTITIKNTSSEPQIIFFEIKISKSDDILIFKVKYQSEGKLHEEIDTFAIVNPEQRGYFSPKTKLLIHVVDSKIVQSYVVGKKYKFENGINESLSKINMQNKDIINLLNTTYENSRKR